MSGRFRKTRYDLVELIVIASVASVIGVALGRGYARQQLAAAAEMAANGLREIEPLSRAFGPQRNSQFAEEWIVRDFFRDKREGFFVDVGASHYRINSTTYFLETALGWRGIAIDAQPHYAEDYSRHRPRTKFYSLFVSDTSGAVADLYVPVSRPLNASGNPAAADDKDAIVTLQVPTTTLTDLLTREGVEKVDFLSMDIELAEPQALAGFDIDRFRPAFVCIEAHPQVRQAILDYFHQHRYVVAGKYLRADVENLYFMSSGE
jgi:FkbM family methyltransferase